MPERANAHARIPPLASRRYTSWLSWAVLRLFEVSGDRELVADVAPRLLTTLRKKWIPGHRLDRCAAGACECAASRADWRARCDPAVPLCFRISDGCDAMLGGGGRG